MKTKTYLLLCLVTSIACAQQLPDRIDFNRHIRPILSNNCFECHGPDQAQRKAKLRLDTREGIFGQRKDGVPIIPGKPAESLLFQRITHPDTDERMPPSDFRRKLNNHQTALLKKWIEQGAEYEGLWSFVPPKIPKTPVAEEGKWVRNPIDRFVLRRLEEEGLKPSPAADKETIIRRVTLDLTGLPPAIGEIDDFLKDQSQDAYERVVKRLLKSPHYGEHMARYWLDLARYADTNGYQYDNPRTQWAWRDWVIEAYNKNMPFNQFTIEQLAGDLLPEATPDQRLATGFNRNHGITIEGGVIDEEYRTEYVMDRVVTTGTVWMGLSLGCARCHDHKYDPITQKEFYQLFAFFNQVPERGLNGFTPNLKAPSMWHRDQLKRIDSEIAAAISEVDKVAATLGSEQEAWEKQILAPVEWETLKPDSVESNSETEFEIDADGTASSRGESVEKETYKLRFPYQGKITGLQLEALPDENHPIKASGRGADGSFVLTGFSATIAREKQTQTAGRYVRVDATGTRWLQIAEVQIFSEGTNVGPKGVAKQSSTGYGGLAKFGIDGNTNGVYSGRSITHTDSEKDPWWEVDLKDTYPIEKIVLWNRTDCCRERLDNIIVSVLNEERQPVWKTSMPRAAPVSQSASLDGTHSIELANAFASHSSAEFPIDSILKGGTGWSNRGALNKPIHATFIAAEATVLKKDDLLQIRLEHNSKPPAASLARFRISITADECLSIRSKLPAEIFSIAGIDADKRTEAQRNKIRDYFIYETGHPKVRVLVEKVRTLETGMQEVLKSLPSTLVMQENPGMRETYLLNRGQYDQQGEKVIASIPASLPPLPKDAPANRLGLAKWLTDPGHPLTSRVTVNRYWMKYFGAGIVKTIDDFGSQAELPSHPELLDWLAMTFIDSGWDIKALQEFIVTSATYRQSSNVSKDLYTLDPENRLLARGPRLRMDAETIRDSALAVSGLLTETLGGPGVFPYQPAGLWVELNNRPGYMQIYKVSAGSELYRRSLYTFWKRTSPPPPMKIFDAPDREFCTATRSRTNTPLQSLVLLNDPQFVEAARQFAERILREGGQSFELRLGFAYRTALGRKPSNEEENLMKELFDSERARFEQDAVAVAALLKVGDTEHSNELNLPELAATTVIARVLLNLDEAITKN